MFVLSDLLSDPYLWARFSWRSFWAIVPLKKTVSNIFVVKQYATIFADETYWFSFRAS